jgi:hypothetical protein
MCRFTDHLKAEAAEWVERIENTNVVGFCAQGIVRVVTSTLTFIVSCPVVAFPQSTRVGSPHDLISFCL